MHPHEAVEMVVKCCVVRRDGRGPWRRGEESLGNEGGLAPNGGDDTIRGAVGAWAGGIGGRGGRDQYRANPEWLRQHSAVVTQIADASDTVDFDEPKLELLFKPPEGS
jgi:hypothetical protein